MDWKQTLLTDILQRLELHSKMFVVFPTASDRELNELWSTLERVDATLKYGEKYRKADFENHNA